MFKEVCLAILLTVVCSAAPVFDSHSPKDTGAIEKYFF